MASYRPMSCSSRDVLSGESASNAVAATRGSHPGALRVACRAIGTTESAAARDSPTAVTSTCWYVGEPPTTRRHASPGSPRRTKPKR